MRLRDMRTPSRVIRPLRPDTFARTSARWAIGNTAAYGSRIRGGLRPTSRAYVCQNLSQRHVLAAQNVALAGTAPVKRHQMARGNVIDVHDVEPGIDVGRHATRGGVQHHLAGGRGLHVARTDGRRRIDDDHREAVFRRLQHHLFGEIFRTLVVTDHRRQPNGRPFVARRAVARYAHGRDAAGVHDSLDARVAGGQQNIAGALDIGAVQLVRIGRAQAVVRGNVKQRLAAGQCTIQR